MSKTKWYTKPIYVMFALALVLSFSMVTAVPVAADTTYYVATTGSDTTGDGSQGNPWATITYAISQSDTGDTINVAAGTYDPFTVDGFTGPLTIKSQHAASPAIVKGCQVYGSSNTIIVITDSTGIDLTDLDIEGEGLEGDDPPINAYAVIYEDATGEVKGCTISPNTAQFSTLEEWGYAHGGHGIAIWNSDNAAVTSNVTVDNCTIKKFGCSGVVIFNGATATVKNSTIIGTVFSLADWDVNATGIDVGASYGHPDAPCTATITGNEIYNVRNTTDATGTMCYGIRINAYKFYDASYQESTVHITDNDIHDNSAGIDANHASPENAYAHNNNIYDNLLDGVLNCSDSTGSFVDFDATSNWWGHASGPYHAISNPTGIGNRVRSYNADTWQTVAANHIDFCPWLLAPYDAGHSETTVDETDYGQKSQEFSGTDTTVDASGTSGTGTVIVQTYNYSVPPDAGGALCADASGKRVLKYIDIKINPNSYTTGNICITISYTAADLAAAGISDESSLSLHYWNPDASPAAWVDAIDSAVDTVANTVYGCIPYDKFSGTPICLGGEAEVTGEYEVGGAPEVTVTFTPSEMDPQVEQTVTVNVDVGAGRTLEELTEVKFKLWYDANAGTTDVGEFTAASDDVQTCATITWDTSTFAMTLDPTGNTWSLGTCTAPTLTNSSGDFTLKFIPGKVATEADGTANNWQLAATATSSYGTGFGYDTTPGAAMNWYGSIALGETVNVDWGSVPAGMDFTNDLADQSLGTTITYICNGDFSKKGKSSATWEGVSNTADLDSTGTCVSTQEFALKAWTSDVVGSAVLLNSTEVEITTGSQTFEAGQADSTNYLYLKLAGIFNSDTYSGTLTYAIRN